MRVALSIRAVFVMAVRKLSCGSPLSGQLVEFGRQAFAVDVAGDERTFFVDQEVCRQFLHVVHAE